MKNEEERKRIACVLLFILFSFSVYFFQKAFGVEEPKTRGRAILSFSSLYILSLPIFGSTIYALIFEKCVSLAKKLISLLGTPRLAAASLRNEIQPYRFRV